MSKTILHPQEIETFYVLPALRRLLAQALKEQGLKQKDIAQIMGINTSAISQYRSSKRGHLVKFTRDIQTEIKHSARLVRDRTSYLQEIQRLLHHIRETNTLCQIHRLFSDLPEICDPQLIGCNKLSRGTIHV